MGINNLTSSVRTVTSRTLSQFAEDKDGRVFDSRDNKNDMVLIGESCREGEQERTRKRRGVRLIRGRGAIIQLRT